MQSKTASTSPVAAILAQVKGLREHIGKVTSSSAQLDTTDISLICQQIDALTDAIERLGPKVS